MKASIVFTIGAVALFLICAVGAFLASGIGTGGLPMSLWLAYGVGTILTITVGAGLFVLTFYSARSGYDDIDRPEDGPTG
ncbi:MAG: hypothetical protein MRY64_11385 [Hyphomonadaceae bacterium]|nr:hypothetical protein [Hyphomonadaceae bacterium]